MQHSRKIRYIIAFFLLGISVLAFVAMNVCIGTVKISLLRLTIHESMCIIVLSS